MTRIPGSTYRLQLHSGFTINDARAVLDYLVELGISDLYASPMLTARSGSQHGYDVTDPLRINPEIGGDAAFDTLARDLDGHQMGLLLDIVPNHMSASLENRWWRDVLQHGERSGFARYFDIDWNSTAPGLAGKVLLPLLGSPYRDVLEAGDLVLDRVDDEWVIRYFENAFPVAPESTHLIEDADDAASALSAMNGTVGDPSSFDALDRLIRAQHYRLAFWRTASSTINYRRFFDVSDLVSLRAEDRAVFDATHQHLLTLAMRGDVTGFRIDHIDGLAEPATYLEWLEEAAPGQDGPFYVVVEKILASDESMPEDWKTAGTSGYDFLNVLNGVFVERRTVDDLDRTYARLRGSETDFDELVYQRKRQVMADLFAGDIHHLARTLWSISGALRAGLDLPLHEVEAAIVEVIAHFSVYRTYTRVEQVSPADRQRIEAAVAAARKRNPDLSRALDVFETVALFNFPEAIDQAERGRWLEFVLRWQQFTGPIMAKGFEDTSLYVYNRLISLNEVGGEPDPAGVQLSDFHEWMADRQERWPGALGATSTHDTKRSEDVRARINVMSELAAEWDFAVVNWQELNRLKKVSVDGQLVPDGNEDHLIYHSMLGAWPFDKDAVPEFRERLKQYLLKASREAKTYTSWIDQHAEHEQAVAAFIDAVVLDDENDPFMQDFLPFQRTVAFHGALNSLSQVLLKATLPGVPDFYQGTELWDLSLVDPDNRRPVDYEKRRRMLDRVRSVDSSAAIGELLEDWESGAVKMHVTWRSLQARTADSELFKRGRYLALYGSGEFGRHVVAFARELDGRWVITVAPRLTVSLAQARSEPLETMPLGDRFWSGVVLTLPDDAPAEWVNTLTGEQIFAGTTESGPVLDVASIFTLFPGGLLQGKHS